LNSLGFSEEVKIGDFVFKSIGGIFGRSALHVFDYLNWPTNDYWTQT
jgi:hypothetical protein